MRKIKYKAWDTLNNRMEKDLFTLGRKLYPDRYNGVYEVFDFDPYFFFSGDRYTPLQYIGLNDKNNTDIYEGDILTDGIETYKCEFQRNSCSTCFVFRGIKNLLVFDGDIKHLEIIGNIYENKNLLEANTPRVQINYKE